jgi:hypothetical protein
MSENDRAITRFLAALLASGRWPGEPASVPRVPAGTLAQAAEREGVSAALFDAVRWDSAPAPEAAALREALAPAARRAAAREILDRMELERVLPRLLEAGHRFLLFKGAPLAHTAYPNPAQRARCDTDILVPPGEAERLIAALAALDYRESTAVRGELVSNQRTLAREDARGNAHAFDVHWKISNRPGLSERLGFEQLWTHSREVPALGARAPGDAHALLLACLHLAGHHPGEERLIWLYDIHLLAQRLSAADRNRFALQCRELDAVPRCLPVLHLAREFFPSPALAETIALLPGGERAPSGRGGRPARLTLLAEDLRDLPGWTQRLRLMKELAFPDAAYMRARYGFESGALLPFYYAKRIFTGAGRWLRRRPAA